MKGLRLIFVAALLLGRASADDGVAFFENRIRPIFVEHCYKCHSAEAKVVKGALKLDTREDFLKGGSDGVVIVAGDPDKSALIQAVRYEDEDLQMPPNKNGGKKLPDAAIADLVAWVKMGAPYPSTPAHLLAKQAKVWALEPVSNPPPPSVRDSGWVETSVDPFVLTKIEEHGGKPAARADRLTLIRRATFDLTGLPPTPEEIDAFTADASPAAFAKVVERLLASPRYGERWGRHWLDVVRYADTAGETADYPAPLAWRYRNYVIDAFNEDKPYDEFLREQIAGDIIARRGPVARYAKRVTATGYLAISRRFGFDSENYHNLTIQDTIDTLGQSVLGLSLGCARCHDHKFDPVSVGDYYALYGIFDSTRYAFPGSEQKQKARAMMPLQPPEEALRKWRDFDIRVASLANRLESQKLAVPAAVLRSLDDGDGDFEMQAPAAGGSNGVLVPPWIYEGKIAVTTAAQSPFKNLYPRGRLGASVTVGAAGYRIAQGIHPRRTRDNCRTLFVNLDFRVAAPSAESPGAHRFWVGGRADSPAVEVLLSSQFISLRAGGATEVIRQLKPIQWQNLQLALDLASGTVSGTVGAPGDVTSFSGKPFSPAWNGAIDFAALDSRNQPAAALPKLELDNFASQELPIPAVSTAAPALANAPDVAALNAELQKLTGIGGDLELQTEGTPPAAPWGPGPNSVVKVSAAAQSPHRNIYAAGGLGLHMPNRGEYDGFGQTLAGVAPDKDGRLFVGFDFRCASKDAGGDGSWRYYIGHGPGNSAAVELFFTGAEFFRRSADTRDVVSALKIGEWYQVQLSLDLKAKTYTGTLTSLTGRAEFSGQLASGWDGTIDYTFIDSYGHRPGVRPALDADNFVIRDTAIPPLDAPPVVASAPQREKVAAIRQQVAAMNAEVEKTKQELNALLTDGPGEMTYGMSEGTPHDARMQVRGEMDRPGPSTPRGFIKALGGGPLPPETEGSGRLELAEWLTRPDNPLVARVMVNRIWQYHFGSGLVKTPNDFGVRGQLPTHPELLDHLATQFIKNGWSVKAMHRLIMLSATYQQGSASDASPDSYAAFPRRRLSAEELRDSILAISGELDLSPAREHPFPSPLGWGYTQHGPFSAVYESNKRSVFLMVQRIKRHPFLALFDGADPNTTTPERRATTVPTQALFFLNDPFVHAKAETCAVRLQTARSDETQRIDLAHRLTLGRPSTDSERIAATEFLAAYRAELAVAGKANAETAALAAYVRTLFGSNEFLHLD